MIKGLNNSQLVQKNIIDNGGIFFVLQLIELFEPKTLDTYQYTLLNTLSGIHELIKIIEKTLNGEFTTNDNMESVREELFRVISEDPILLSYYGALLNRLKFHLGSRISKGNNEKENKALQLKILNELKCSQKILEEDYIQHLLTELKLNIDTNCIDKICLLNKIFACHLINIGWTYRGITDLVRHAFLRGQAKDEDFNHKWSNFIDLFLKENDFTVYIKLSQNTVNNEKYIELLGKVRSLGIQIISYDEIIDSYREFGEINIPAKADKFYMKFRVTAKDLYAAGQIAINELNKKMTVLAFYNIITAWSLNELDGFIINEYNKYIRDFKIGDLYKTTLQLDSSNKVFINTLELFSDETFINSNTGNALIGVFNYTNISLVSIFPEEKFINLWISLESLMKTGQYNNIISHIKEVLPAILCKRYIYRILRNFAEDCDRCKVSLQLDEFTIDIRDESKKNMVRNLIKAIQDKNTYAILESRCTVNTLLLYRLKEISQLVENNITIINKIRRYHKTVFWHIQRLYRIRNEIAHSALQENNNILILSEHLYDYLAVLISEIVYISTEKNIKDIDMIFPYLKDNYDSFNELIVDERGKTMFVQNFQLVDGIIDFLD